MSVHRILVSNPGGKFLLDWFIVAKDLAIEKLWVWVFDMTDEEAAAVKVQNEDSEWNLNNKNPPPFFMPAERVRVWATIADQKQN